MDRLNFDTAFAAITGNKPFPWQHTLYVKHFSKGDIPASCNLPTGLGKTSVIAVWLIALANGHESPATTGVRRKPPHGGGPDYRGSRRLLPVANSRPCPTPAYLDRLVRDTAG